MTRKILLLFSLLVSTKLQAQQAIRPLPVDHIYLGAEGSGLINFSSFADHQIVDHGLRKPPLPTGAWGVALRQNLTPRLALETGVSVIEFGYKSIYTFDYPGGRKWTAQSTGTHTFGLIQLPIKLVYVLSKANRPWRKYLGLGVNLYYNEYGKIAGNVGGVSVITGPNPGDRFTFRASRQSGSRLNTGLTLGLGWERDLGGWGLIQIGPVFNYGFQSVAVWDLEYTTWHISQAIDGITYTNTIRNKGHFAGLRLSLLVKL